jgi:hypothetical protein
MPFREGTGLPGGEQPTPYRTPDRKDPRWLVCYWGSRPATNSAGILGRR